jgi:glycosyltransferase involved in cell wall biosynthesis
VVWNGVDPVCFSDPVPDSPIEYPYVLFVGTPEPRKNLPRLITAMNLLSERGFPHRLVIAGGGGWGHVAIDHRSAQLMGRVGDRELLSLYAHADCLALPSLHEGFGLPAVEAMAAGTPVVAGNKGALPEVVGGAGILVDPYDVAAIAAGIERAISERKQLAPPGRARANQFTWERAAESMSAIYHELA